MTALEVFRKCRADEACKVARQKKGQPGQYDCKGFYEGSHRGWTVVDLFTASTVCQVHDALKPENQAKFASLPLVRMAEVAFAVLAK